jgi:transposase InsO family protein
MRPDARAELVVDALEMALWRRRPAPGPVHHSDRGSQYSSLRFGARLRAARILPSMGRKGDAYEVALCEAFFATLHREVLSRCRFRTRDEARSLLFAYLEGFYNRRRRAWSSRHAICGNPPLPAPQRVGGPAMNWPASFTVPESGHEVSRPWPVQLLFRRLSPHEPSRTFSLRYSSGT